MVVDNNLLQLQSCIYSLLFIFVIIIILLYTALLIIFYKIPINISEYLHLYVQCGGECHRSNNTINSVYPLMLFFSLFAVCCFYGGLLEERNRWIYILASFTLSSSPRSLPPSLSLGSLSDFSATVYVIHFIFCCCYGGFPISLAWWLTNIVSLVIMTVISELLSWQWGQ